MGSWARIDGLVVESDVVKFLADKKGARARARGQAELIAESELGASSGAEFLEPEDDAELPATASSGVEDAAFSDDDMYV